MLYVYYTNYSTEVNYLSVFIPTLHTIINVSMSNILLLNNGSANFERYDEIKISHHYRNDPVITISFFQ